MWKAKKRSTSLGTCGAATMNRRQSRRSQHGKVVGHVSLEGKYVGCLGGLMSFFQSLIERPAGWNRNRWRRK